MHLVFVEFPLRVRHLRAPLRFDAPDDSGATRASGGRVRSSGTGPGRARLPGGHCSVSPRHCPTSPQVHFGLASATITSRTWATLGPSVTARLLLWRTFVPAFPHLSALVARRSLVAPGTPDSVKPLSSLASCSSGNFCALFFLHSLLSLKCWV